MPGSAFRRLNPGCLRRVVLATAVLLFHVVPAHASLDPSEALTQYVRKTWGSDTGLSESSVMSIAQTPDGYLWVGTEGGLYRFDGTTFTRFDKQNTRALRTNVITALLVDRRGVLWIGTAGKGVVWLVDGEFRRAPAVSGGGEDSVTSFFEDRHGRMFVGTDGHGLIRFDHGNAERLTRADGLPNDTIFSVSGDGEDTVWIATQSGISQIAGKRRIRIATDAKTSLSDARSIFCDRTGALWIGTRRAGLYRLDKSGLQRFGLQNGLSSDSIGSVYEDSSGTVWVGTLDNGINRFANGRFTSLTAQNGFPGGGVWAVFEDRAGSIWLGGTETGLSCLRQGVMTPFGKQEGLSSDTVLGLYRDRQNRLWIGSDQGLNVLFQGQFKHYTTSNGLPDNLVFATTQDDHGVIWTGTRHGLAWMRADAMRGDTFVAYHAPQATKLAGSILSVQASRHGGIWAAGRGVLSYITEHSIRTYTQADGLPDKVILCLYEDDTGTLWAGTDGGGLLRFANGQFTSYSSHDGLSSDTICSITGEPDGTLWLGTRGGGLVRFAKGKFVAITRETGLSDDDVFSVLDDTLGRLWFSSNKGIFSARTSDLQAFAAGRRNTISSDLFDTSNGMRTRECNGGFQGTALRGADGTLWFPTMKGLVNVHPAKVSSPQAPPAVVIEKVLADDKPVANQDPLTVPAGAKQLELRFSSPYLAGPDFVRYKYILEGFDKNWGGTESRRSANYTNLSPGAYRFRILACVGDACTPTPTEVNLKILASWYETRTFHILVALLFAGCLHGVNKLHVRHLKAKERKLQGLIDDRTRELRESHEQLESRVEERTAELSVANERLETEVLVRRTAEEKAAAASQAKSQFLTNMSHELRTPMNGVIGMANLALELSGNDQQREYLELLSQSADHLLCVLNDILDFSKIESGKLLLEDLEFDLVELLEKLVRTMLPLATRKGVILVAGLAPNLPRCVVADPTRLRQVLLNLLGNAIKFTEQGTIELKVKRIAEDQLHFSVSDTGIGIPKHKQASIFQSFVQADGGTARKFGGTGLGLAISDRLVRLMGGVIEVQSEEGIGTTFCFAARMRIAAVRHAQARLAESECRISASAEGYSIVQRLRILVAEDNRVNQRLAKAILEKAGHSVTLVGDGLEAIAAFTEREYDLILMDVQMPRMDGLTAASEIRRQEEGMRRTPILALTAHAMQGDQEKCFEAGMDGYLTKPIDVRKLTAEITALSIPAGK
ncbi:MAG TPA: two-component regulator propeller domain-containing protein [Bryobacteraceae bacterium]|jgi:signal transduction histidine kinase/ligand-binding sensor domain-containing protein/CheY-like chemotaxis protein|nr:two-component regulator propeller domain-containing protein [Bryobacteraceae bacterium]